MLPGLYRLDIAIKDVNNPDHVGFYGSGLDVPEYHDEKLATSTLILADQMNAVYSHAIGERELRDRQYLHPAARSANAATPVSSSAASN